MERSGIRECLPSAGEAARLFAAAVAGLAVMWAISYATEPPGGYASWAYMAWACLCFMAAGLAAMGAPGRNAGLLYLAGLCGIAAGAAYAVMFVLAWVGQ